MEILRIVVTGGVGAGKTSFIRTISEIETVDTDRKATDEIALLKEKTTVALDFGRLTIAPNQSLHLYGTPGQVRFDFMWDILIQKAHAYILLIDAHRPEHLRYSRKILQFMKHRVQIPCLIGLTHTDCPDAWQMEDIALALGLLDENNRLPIISVNPTEAASVKKSLIALLEEFAKYYQYSTE
ncbi:GTP-binding protein [Fischerella thermalis]|uniref:GTP-binding protein n=1 Tax=Fischerella thermalis TaxID=372787 RepID=UPI000C7FD9D8|nr:ATP/GTP-binding protein [Fischerella thermalis]MBF1991776.1 ATP/GTP-binding protein [Fischerella thermalis M58_A2018_009]MBF2059372.1 ATP/GTP-binding protein [Fischerella thermalis M66_A2018_004]MBF2071692.1 ATP/GTP-binding protein [Fischerella thermalis M48_A2018_028]PLZ88137.1 GTPase [Fischerella thermalis CCMEE 5194]